MTSDLRDTVFFAVVAGVLVAGVVFLLVLAFGKTAFDPHVAPVTVAGNGEDQRCEPSAAELPFRFTVVDVDDNPHSWGPQVVVELETTADAAKAATKADLRRLREMLHPSLGNRRQFIQLKTSDSNTYWGEVSRINDQPGGKGEWQIDVRIND